MLVEAARLTVISFIVGLVSLVAIAALIVLPGAKRRLGETLGRRRLESKLPSDPQERLVFLINRSIATEIELEAGYRRLAGIGNQLEGLGENQAETGRLLEHLAEENHGHKVLLEKMLIELK